MRRKEKNAYEVYVLSYFLFTIVTIGTLITFTLRVLYNY